MKDMLMSQYWNTALALKRQVSIKFKQVQNIFSLNPNMKVTQAVQVTGKMVTFKVFGNAYFN